MKERIAAILDHYGLSSSKLADILTVQRSGISHILSGRNNPGYDFLVKLLGEFPEINANWLLTGNGSMLKINQGNDETPGKIDESDSTLFTDITRDRPTGRLNQKKESSELDYKSKQFEGPDKEIHKIVIFYKDGRFEDFSR